MCSGYNVSISAVLRRAVLAISAAHFPDTALLALTAGGNRNTDKPTAVPQSPPRRHSERARPARPGIHTKRQFWPAKDDAWSGPIRRKRRTIHGQDEKSNSEPSINFT